MYVPLVGQFDIGWLYVPIATFAVVGMANAVNLTDGMDGLAASVTFIAMSALTALTYVASDARWASYLDLTHKPEAAELTQPRPMRGAGAHRSRVVPSTTTALRWKIRVKTAWSRR